MPDEPFDPGDAFRRLKESLGSLMFCWCRLEDAVNKRFRANTAGSRAKSGGSLAEQLTVLEDQLLAKADHRTEQVRSVRDLFSRIDDVRQRRNLIAHCLAGVSSDPAKGEPHILCVRPDAKSRTSIRVTQTELSGLCEAIERCRRDIELIDFQLDRSLG